MRTKYQRADTKLTSVAASSGKIVPRWIRTPSPKCGGVNTRASKPDDNFVHLVFPSTVGQTKSGDPLYLTIICKWCKSVVFDRHARSGPGGKLCNPCGLQYSKGRTMEDARSRIKKPRGNWQVSAERSARIGTKRLRPEREVGPYTGIHLYWHPAMSTRATLSTQVEHRGESVGVLESPTKKAVFWTPEDPPLTPLPERVELHFNPDADDAHSTIDDAILLPMIDGTSGSPPYHQGVPCEPEQLLAMMLSDSRDGLDSE